MSKTVLYFAPGACSLAPHIALREAGIDFELAKVDLRAKTLDDGSDFRAVTAKGYVPALKLDNGELLTEVGTILTYIASKAAPGKLAPELGSFAWFRTLERLNYISTEIHKSFGPLFHPNTTDDARAALKERIIQRLGLFEELLASQPFLAGDQPDVSDIYLATLLTWTRWVQVDTSSLPQIEAFRDRMLAREHVAAAIEAEKAARSRN